MPQLPSTRPLESSTLKTSSSIYSFSKPRFRGIVTKKGSYFSNSYLALSLNVVSYLLIRYINGYTKSFFSHELFEKLLKMFVFHANPVNQNPLVWHLDMFVIIFFNFHREFWSAFLVKNHSIRLLDTHRMWKENQPGLQVRRSFSGISSLYVFRRRFQDLQCYEWPQL